MRSAGMGGALALAGALAGCLGGMLPDGAARCGQDTNGCPSGYHCAPDQRCWQDGHVPPSLCAAAPASALCDGFESGTIDPPWTAEQNHGAVTIDTSRAYRGHASLAIHADMLTTQMQPQLWLSNSTLLSRPLPDVWMRAFYYAGKLPQSATLFSVGQGDPPYGGEGIIVEPSGTLALWNDFAMSYHASDRRLGVAHWTCLEWHVHFSLDGKSGYQELFADGVAASGVTVMQATDAKPRANSAQFGFWWAPPVAPSVPAFDAWIDEVELDTQRIGCDH